MFTPSCGRESRLPSIVVNINDAYAFRSAMDIVSKIQSDICLTFNKKGIIVEETSNDATKSVRVNINEDNLLGYHYDVRDSMGNVVETYRVTVSAHKLVKSIGVGSRKDGIMITVCVDPVMLTSAGLFLMKEGGINLTDLVPALDKTYDKPYIRDYYTEVFVKKEVAPNAKESSEMFVECLKRFKEKKEKVQFIRKIDGNIAVQCANNPNTAALLNNGPYSLDEQVEPLIEKQSSQIIGGWLTVDIPSSEPSICLNVQTITLIMQISKTCVRSIVKFYMSHNCPLIMVTNVGIFGTCVLSFNNDAE